MRLTQWLDIWKPLIGSVDRAGQEMIVAEVSRGSWENLYIRIIRAMTLQGP